MDVFIEISKVMATFGAIMLLITVHEIGHCIAAALLGISISKFSLGVGPAICSIRLFGIAWELCWFPFGGYVKFVDGNNENSFEASSFYKKILVIVSGPLFNFGLSLCLFSVLFHMGGVRRFYSNVSNVVGSIKKESILYKMGLRPGFWIKNISHVGISNKYFESVSLVDSNEVTVCGTVPVASFNDLSFGGFVLFSGFSGSKSVLNNDIKPGYRIIWCNGQQVLSFDALAESIGFDSSFVTIERDGSYVYETIKNVSLSSLSIDSGELIRLDDLFFEVGRNGVSSHLFLPAFIDTNLIVRKVYNGYSIKPLDRIVAINGSRVGSLAELIDAIDHKSVFMICDVLPVKDFQDVNATMKDFYFPFIEPEYSNAVNNVLSGAISDQGRFKIIGPIELSTWRNVFDVDFDRFVKKIQAVQASLSYKSELMDMLNIKSAPAALGWQFSDVSVMENVSPLDRFSSAFFKHVYLLKAFINDPSVVLQFIAGPIGTSRELYRSMSSGLAGYIYFVGSISFSLGFINLLPIPPLDGGKLLLVMVELLGVNSKTRALFEFVMYLGMIAVVSFILFRSVLDIAALFQSWLP